MNVQFSSFSREYKNHGSTSFWELGLFVFGSRHSTCTCYFEFICELSNEFCPNCLNSSPWPVITRLLKLLELFHSKQITVSVLWLQYLLFDFRNSNQNTVTVIRSMKLSTTVMFYKFLDISINCIALITHRIYFIISVNNLNKQKLSIAW